MSIISTKELQSLCMQALHNAGMRPQDAKMATDHYLHNEMCGKSSHGIVRVIEAAKMVQKFGATQQDIKIIQESDEILIMDAMRHVGAVAVQNALLKGLEKIKNRAITFIGIRDYIASSGSLSYYLQQVAHAGIIGIMGCNSVALVAPPAGKKRVIGTNPLGIAIPGDKPESALIGDIATSAIAYGKIMVMNDKGEDVPEGLMIDKDGNPSCNPKDAYDGAILPLADYKGFGLGLMIELLAGPLIGAKAIKQDLYDNDGFFIILINPEKFGNPLFYSEISNALDTIKSGEPRSGYDHISIPGDRAAQHYKRIMDTDTLDIASQTLDKLKMLLLTDDKERNIA